MLSTLMSIESTTYTSPFCDLDISSQSHTLSVHLLISKQVVSSDTELVLWSVGDDRRLVEWRVENDKVSMRVWVYAPGSYTTVCATERSRSVNQAI